MAGKPVAIIMGSQSDWPTMKHTADTLDALGIGYEAKIISAHRTPERHSTFTKAAKAQGFKIIIAGAGGAAHLPGVTAALTTLPVFGVPIESKALSGVDSLYSIVQMPPGVPVGTLAIGRAGAKPKRCPRRPRTANPERGDGLFALILLQARPMGSPRGRTLAAIGGLRHIKPRKTIPSQRNDACRFSSVTTMSIRPSRR